MNTKSVIQPHAAGEAADCSFAHSSFDGTKHPRHAFHVLSRTAGGRRFCKEQPMSYARIAEACNAHEGLVERLERSNESLAVHRDVAIERGDSRAARLIGETIEANLAALAKASA